MERGHGAVDGGHVDGWGEINIAAFVEFAAGSGNHVPPDEVLDDGDSRVGGHHHLPLVCVAGDQAGGVRPFGEGFFGGAEVLPVEERPRVEQHGGTITAVCDLGFGPGGGDDNGWFGGDGVDDFIAAGHDDCGLGKGPAEFFGGAVVS